MSPLDSHMFHDAPPTRATGFGIDLPLRRMPAVPHRDGGAQADLYAVMLRDMAEKLREAESRLAEQQERIAYLETLSLTDELTGLLNRRGFTEAFRRELATARRTGTGGVLVIIDLDGFKVVNDTHGHLAGDQYLRRVAKVLAEKVRGMDVVARLGGDEFALLLTDTTAEAGLARATAIAAALNAESCALGAAVLTLRASFGAEPYGPEDREDEVSRRADMLMYRTKASRKAKR